MSSLGQADQPQRQPVAWPVVSGALPPLADSAVTRQETGLNLAAALPPGRTTVLIPPAELAGRSLGTRGGTGKTQLAAALAAAQLESRTADLVVWITATGPDAVIEGYAQALRDVGGPDRGASPEQAASRFLDWLAATSRPWLVVLDGLRSAAAVMGRWPQGPAGRVLVTTEQRDAAAHAPRPQVVTVGMFSPREALGYLSVKLRADPDQRVGAVDLAGALGYIPVTLTQAAAYIAETGIDCGQYRARWEERTHHPALAAAGIDSPGMIAAWWLSAELADQLPPAGIARRALALISLLAPAGIPGAVLTSQAARTYLTGQPSGGRDDEAQARAAIHNLARVGLLTVNTHSAARTVAVHPTVQAFTRQSLPEPEAGQVARVAADALAQVWLRQDLPAGFDQALRDCTASLREHAGSLLWRPECHPVLLEAGRSLDRGRLAGPAAGYWEGLLTASRRTLGPEQPQTIMIRDLLAGAYQRAGRLDEAIRLYEAALRELERTLGSGHPDTIAARDRLSSAYLTSEHTDGAIVLAERALADRQRVLGPAHPDTLSAYESLARCYLTAGRHADAVTAFTRALAGREETLGPRHPDTIAARGALASAYLEAGRPKEAIAECKRGLADSEQFQGSDHPDTIAARARLAAAYRSANKRKEALRLYERTLADSERVLGPDHPDTISARAELAAAYEGVGKHAYAIAQYERAAADAERVLGPTHPFTQVARDNLNAAASYAQSVLGIDLRGQGRT